MREEMIRYSETHHLFSPGDKIIVGVSGGADSVCLLYLLNSLRKEMNLSLFVLHVKHGIRITPFDEESEDYPSVDSIKRWKSWVYDIRRLLLVTIHTRWSLIPDNILKLVLSNSLLLNFREDLHYNWLLVLLKLLYNYLQPFY